MNSAGRCLFDWARYIALSENLLERMAEDEEDLARCGISRAYYGAFHLVVAYMKQNNLYRNVVGEGSHQTVIRDCASFQRASNQDAGKLWGQISEALKRLRDLRKKADYEGVYFRGSIPPVACMKNELIKAIHHAKDVQEKVASLRIVEAP